MPEDRDRVNIRLQLSASDPDTFLNELRESLATDVLREDYPIELVEESLRAAGGDPEAIGRRGAALVEGMLAGRRGESPRQVVDRADFASVERSIAERAGLLDEGGLSEERLAQSLQEKTRRVSARGCRMDTDGDGNCPAHPSGCPGTGAREHSLARVPRCVCPRTDTDVPEKTPTDAPPPRPLDFSPGSPELAAFERMNELVSGKFGTVPEEQDDSEPGPREISAGQFVVDRAVGRDRSVLDVRGAEAAFARGCSVVIACSPEEFAGAAGKISTGDSALVVVAASVSPLRDTQESKSAALRVVRSLAGIDGLSPPPTARDLADKIVALVCSQSGTDDEPLWSSVRDLLVLNATGGPDLDAADKKICHFLETGVWPC